MVNDYDKPPGPSAAERCILGFILAARAAFTRGDAVNVKLKDGDDFQVQVAESVQHTVEGGLVRHGSRKAGHAVVSVDDRHARYARRPAVVKQAPDRDPVVVMLHTITMSINQGNRRRPKDVF